MLKQSKFQTHGVKQPPTTPRPSKPPSQSVNKQDLTDNILMWRKELERQGASHGIMNVFDSICTYFGEQQRK